MQSTLLLAWSVATAALGAPVAESWPALGGTTGFHRMNGKVKPTCVLPSTVTSWYDSGVRLAGAPESRLAALKEQGQALVSRRKEVTSLFEAMMIAKDPMFVDEAVLVAAQNFPLSEAELITKAKEFLYYGQGVERPSLLADSFVFMGPFVGGGDGLPRAEYLEAVGGFDIKAAFPDLEPRFHHFRADPLDPGRIWFTSQAGGTDLGGFLGNEPTGKRFETPPQACSIKFDENGQVVKYTIGHVMERSIGNTGGLGGIFGPAYAIGKPLPFPEANPWRPSKRYRTLMLMGQLLSWLKKRKSQ